MSVTTTNSQYTSLNHESSMVTVLNPSSSKIFEMDSIKLNETFDSLYDLQIAISDTYKSHPPSFFVSTILIITNIINLTSFIIWGGYLLHPFLSFGILICGIGMLSTMYLANR